MLTLWRDGCFVEGDHAIVPGICSWARGDVLEVDANGEVVWRRLHTEASCMGDLRTRRAARLAYSLDAVVVTVGLPPEDRTAPLQFAAFAACASTASGAAAPFVPVEMAGASDLLALTSSVLADSGERACRTTSLLLPRMRRRLDALEVAILEHANGPGGVTRSRVGVQRRAREHALLQSLREGHYPPYSEARLQRLLAQYSNRLLVCENYSRPPSTSDFVGMLSSLGVIEPGGRGPRVVYVPDNASLLDIYPDSPPVSDGRLPTVQVGPLLRIVERERGPLKPDCYLHTVAHMLRCCEPVTTPEFEEVIKARREASGIAPMRHEGVDTSEEEKPALRALVNKLTGLGVFERITEEQMADPDAAPIAILGCHRVLKGDLKEPPLEGPALSRFREAMKGNGDLASLAVGAIATAERVVSETYARAKASSPRPSAKHLTRAIDDALSAVRGAPSERLVLHGNELRTLAGVPVFKLRQPGGFRLPQTEQMLGGELLKLGRWVGTSDAVKYYYVVAYGRLNSRLYCFEPIRGEGVYRARRCIMGASDSALIAGGLLTGLLLFVARLQLRREDEAIDMYIDDASPTGDTEESANEARLTLTERTFKPARIQAASIESGKTRVAAQRISPFLGHSVDTVRGEHGLPPAKAYKYMAHGFGVLMLLEGSDKLRLPALARAVSHESANSLYSRLSWWAICGKVSMRCQLRGLAKAAHSDKLAPVIFADAMIADLRAWCGQWLRGATPLQRFLFADRTRLAARFGSDADDEAGGAIFGAAALFLKFDGVEMRWPIDLKELLVSVLGVELLVAPDPATKLRSILLLETDNSSNVHRLNKGKAEKGGRGGRHRQRSAAPHLQRCRQPRPFFPRIPPHSREKCALRRTCRLPLSRRRPRAMQSQRHSQARRAVRAIRPLCHPRDRIAAAAR